MNKIKAQELALSLMAKHGVGHVPFKFNNGKRMLGVASFMTNRTTGVWRPVSLGLSSYWTLACDESEVRDTILHEIAHLLAGPRAGHGTVWKAHARAIGAKAQRCGEPSQEAQQTVAKMAPAAWVGTCPAGHTATMHRAPGRVRSCNKCHPTFKKENIFSWKKNGQTVAMPQSYREELFRIQNNLPNVRKPKNRPKKGFMTLEGMFEI